MVTQGRFREDLYYRLNTFPIRLPPLRKRMEDLPTLVQHFINKFNSELGKQIRGLTPQALHKLMAYSWRGNIRELENMVK